MFALATAVDTISATKICMFCTGHRATTHLLIDCCNGPEALKDCNGPRRFVCCTPKERRDQEAELKRLDEKHHDETATSKERIEARREWRMLKTKRSDQEFRVCILHKWCV